MDDTPDFSTCDLCDAHEADQPPLLRVLPPVFRDFGTVPRFAGPVATLRVGEDYTIVRNTTRSPGQGRVLLVACGGSVARAVFGGLAAAEARENGWAGIVVDGAVRDLFELKAAGIGVKALALVPQRAGKGDSGERDVPVTVQGVEVRPGCWLYTDDDGIVIAPHRVH